MNTRLTAQFALLALVGAAMAGGLPVAQAQDPKTLPANPVGVGGNWSQTVKQEPAGQEFDKKQMELIQKVSAYFNQMGDLKGAFVQTSADNKRLRGKFYVKRPGRFRFDYSPPSRMVVLSDGQYLAIQDHDLKTDDRVSLDQTPFRVLLRKDVDLLRDARILEVGEKQDRIVLELQDKNPDAHGRIKLFLLNKPAVELKEWITTDAQGLETKIELTELSRTEDLDAAMFRPPSIYLQRVQ